MKKTIPFTFVLALVPVLFGAATPAMAQQVQVPYVVDMTQADAEMTILSAGLLPVVISYEYSYSVAEGHVIEQYPDAGSPVAGDSEVKLAISIGLGPAGPQQAQVHDVVGADVDWWMFLHADNFALVISHEYDDRVPAGCVIRQDPEGGLAPTGSTVELTISKGPAPVGPQQVQVPYLVRMSKAGAEAAISSAGLNLGLVWYEYSDFVAEGHVIDQYPDAGNQAPAGSTVDLTISLGSAGPGTVTVPDVVDMTRAGAEAAISSAGFNVGAISYEHSDFVAEGHVIDQYPDAGNQAPAGSTVSLTISLGPLNHPPVANNDAYAVNQDDTLTVAAPGVLANDSDPDNDTLTAGLDSGPSNGTLTFNSDGSFTYMPYAGFLGTDTFTYTVTDDWGLSATATVTVTVAGILVEVPRVVDMTEANAMDELAAVGLDAEFAWYEYSGKVPAGHIITQDPLPGETVAIGSTVTLTTSLGPPGPGTVTVPDVVGMAWVKAMDEIKAVGLDISESLWLCDDTVSMGYVTSQNPAPGTSAAIGSSVALTVSMGPCIWVEVPDVVGMTEGQAMDELAAVGLDAEFASYEYSDTITAGHVITQDPVPHYMADPGSTVTLTISLGSLNHPPEANDDAYAVNQDDILTVAAPGVLGNDSDPDDDTLTAELDSAPANGTLTLDPDGSLTYIPDAGFLGTDTFTYTVTDDWGLSATATVTITVGGTVVEVPDVVGMAESEAKSMITSAGLTVGTISSGYSDTVSKGCVISQSPSGGTSVSEGSSVSLRISMGPEPDEGPPAPPDKSCLIAHWKLDDGSDNIATDSSGNGFDITLHNTAWEDGMFGGAVHFHGVGYGDVGNFNYSENAITVCAWVWHDEFIVGKIERYVTVGPSIAVIRKENDGRLHFYISTDGNLRHLWVDDVLTEGQWHHVAGTWDGLTQRLYIDGVEIASQVPGGVLGRTSNSNVMISCGEESFNGMLDDVRIYNCALSADNIRWLLDIEPIDYFVAHWKLDEMEGTIAYDSAGQSDGILYGNPIWQPTGGVVGGALLFDGIDDYVDCGNDPLFDITESITLACWIKVDVYDKPWQSIITKGNSGWRLHRAGETDSVAIHCAGLSTGVQGKVNVNDGRWHHVAGVYDGTRIYLYVDGVTDNFKVATGTIRTNTLAVMIGQNVESPWRLWTGLIDDVRIYSSALSGNEIKSLAGALAAHWKLDEMEGAIAYDSSACDNHGILAGNPQWVAGRLNGALKFDGIDDYVDCGSDASLDITDQITLAVWVKTNDAGNSEFNPYVTKGDTAYGLKHHENNNIEFVIYDQTWYMTHFPVNSSFNGVWHHLAGTYDGSELKFYLDGTLKLTSAHKGSIASSAASVNIARDSEITDWFYDGLIDDVRIYNRALNAQEIEEAGY